MKINLNDFRNVVRENHWKQLLYKIKCGQDNSKWLGKSNKKQILLSYSLASIDKLLFCFKKI